MKTHGALQKRPREVGLALGVELEPPPGSPLELGGIHPDPLGVEPVSAPVRLDERRGAPLGAIGLEPLAQDVDVVAQAGKRLAARAPRATTPLRSGRSRQPGGARRPGTSATGPGAARPTHRPTRGRPLRPRSAPGSGPEARAGRWPRAVAGSGPASPRRVRSARARGRPPRRAARRSPRARRRDRLSERSPDRRRCGSPVRSIRSVRQCPERPSAPIDRVADQLATGQGSGVFGRRVEPEERRALRFMLTTRRSSPTSTSPSGKRSNRPRARGRFAEHPPRGSSPDP